jgi:integrase/recombinase XerD
MATAKIILDNRRIKTDKTYPVKVRITHERKINYFSTKFSFAQTEFERIESKSRLTDEQKAISTKLNAIEQKASDIINDLEFFDFETFKVRFTSKGNKTDILFLLNDKSESLKALGKVNNSNLYKQTAELLKAYSTDKLKKSEININTINPKWLKDFESWVLSLKKTDKTGLEVNKYSVTTLSMYLIRLRAIFNEAIDSKQLNRNQYPFSKPDNKKGFKIPKGINNKRALSKAEITQIYNYIPKSDTEQLAKDIFIFSYLAAGMNTIDILRLKWSSIESNQITFIRKKTENKAGGLNKIKINLNEDLNEIIERQGSRKINNDYIFNIIPSKANEVELINKVKITIATVNNSLKRIAKKIGITENISTYYARHSYATNLMNGAVPLAFISKQLGHTDLKTTQNYLDGFTTDKAAEYESNLLDKKIS